MSAGYDQFCPVAKAAEIFATRWTPLILRELMSGTHSFNDIARGVPLISRAVLVARLRELERNGIIERRVPTKQGSGEYWLTPAGEDFRAVMESLGQWGVIHTFNRIGPSDLDPALLMSGLSKRIDRSALPQRRMVLRFEFSGVPTIRTKFRIMWLVLGRSSVDICIKDPGFAVDLTLRGQIRDWVAIYLGQAIWSDFARTAFQMEGDREIARKLPAWLRLDTIRREGASPAPQHLPRKQRPRFPHRPNS
jgi:DNA-binding HxlR family transcriptional regulator